MATASEWLDALPKAPVSSVMGETTAWHLRGPLPTEGGLWSKAGELLGPLIERTLPGYADGRIAGRCLCRAEYGRLWTQDDRAVGFAACRSYDVRGHRVVYLTLSAFMPHLQGRGLLRSTLDDVIAASGASLIAATTNVPAIYRVLSRASMARRGTAALTLPAATGDVRSSAALVDFGRAVLGGALEREPGAIPLDARWVRRRYRDRDLQDIPMPGFLAGHAGSSLAPIATFFADGLELDVGDAALVVADLDGTLHHLLERSTH